MHVRVESGRGGQVRRREGHAGGWPRVWPDSGHAHARPLGTAGPGRTVAATGGRAITDGRGTSARAVAAHTSDTDRTVSQAEARLPPARNKSQKKDRTGVPVR